MTSSGDVIPLKVYLAAEDAMQFLKQNAHVEGLFRIERGSSIKPRLVQAMKRGDRQALSHLLYPNSEELARIPGLSDIGFATADSYIAVECSAALISLLGCLPKPLFPVRVQRLVLGGNEGVPVQSVACDALGLLKQDISGRHLNLVTSFLDLLYTVSKNARFSELGGPSVAATLLPVVFQLQAEDVCRWQNSAAIFSELITMAPKYFSRGPPNALREGDDRSIAPQATPSEVSQVSQGPVMDAVLPGQGATPGCNSRRRQRRRSHRRCALPDMGEPDVPVAIRAQVQGILHPALAAAHHQC
ncbi:uncharacterized protein LOC124158809 isoform X2 [Ischnura elegans]|nr:uncharacterized protein LOC124158809 isoform X2 [Ischnura elegans]